jgi:hypothetical protein
MIVVHQREILGLLSFGFFGFDALISTSVGYKNVLRNRFGNAERKFMQN